MHDPTEGGVVTGLLEIARAAGTGLAIDLDAIPILIEGATLCREFGLDPLGTIASGSILLTAPEAAAPKLIAALDAAGYPTARIGRVTRPEDGLVATQGGSASPGRAMRRTRSRSSLRERMDCRSARCVKRQTSSVRTTLHVSRLTLDADRIGLTLASHFGTSPSLPSSIGGAARSTTSLSE